MDGKLNIKVVAIGGIDPKVIEEMTREFKKPSTNQKLAEDLFKAKEENSSLENRILLLKDERTRLKSIVEAALAVMVGVSYEKVNDEERSMLDEFRSKAAQALKLSDMLSIVIEN